MNTCNAGRTTPPAITRTGQEAPRHRQPLHPQGWIARLWKACVGGAFYPGIEAGGLSGSRSIIDPSKYLEPFRLNHMVLSPGDLTYVMALPWQNDFYQCADYWWPVPRPNYVVRQGTAGQSFISGVVSGGQGMVDNWHKLGFIVRQGAQYIEVDRCDVAPAPCTLACPAHNDIPSAMWHIEQGEFIEAAQRYRRTSSMPEICGRVCPQEQLCQGSCSHVKSHAAVLTGPLEAFVTCYERRTVGVRLLVGEPTGKRVGIVGSGPAGLACAEQLRQRGHDVTIFVAKPAPGGLLTYAIPNFKLPKEVVFARVAEFEDAGVEFHFNTYIGKDKTVR